MSDETDLLRAIVGRPAEASQTWLVLADLLEERGDPRHELIRLQHQPAYRPDLAPRARQARMVELLVAGLRPCVPTVRNELGMSFVWVSAGSFTMGSPRDEPARYADEDQFAVTLTRGFWMGQYPVTQAEWKAVTGDNPSRYRGKKRRPVEVVSHDDCLDFCAALGKRDGNTYRLPTEAEWEYACRAGTTTPFFWGDTITTELVNYDGNYVYGPGGDGGTVGLFRQATVPVDTFPPNAWGLYDMHGNVLEWCSDWKAAYPDGPAVDPTGPEDGTTRAARGGSWFLFPRRCRSADRRGYPPDTRDDKVGVRLVLAVRRDDA